MPVREISSGSERISLRIRMYLTGINLSLTAPKRRTSFSTLVACSFELPINTNPTRTNGRPQVSRERMGFLVARHVGAYTRTNRNPDLLQYGESDRCGR